MEICIFLLISRKEFDCTVFSTNIIMSNFSGEMFSLRSFYIFWVSRKTKRKKKETLTTFRYFTCKSYIICRKINMKLIEYYMPFSSSASYFIKPGWTFSSFFCRYNNYGLRLELYKVLRQSSEFMWQRTHSSCARAQPVKFLLLDSSVNSLW